MLTPRFLSFFSRMFKLVAFLEIALGKKMEREGRQSFIFTCLHNLLSYHSFDAVGCTLVPRSKIENPTQKILKLHASDFLLRYFLTWKLQFCFQIQREQAMLMKILLQMAKRQWWLWKVDGQIYLVTLKLNRRMTACIWYFGIAKTPALLSTGLWYNFCNPSTAMSRTSQVRTPIRFQFRSTFRVSVLVLVLSFLKLKMLLV